MRELAVAIFAYNEASEIEATISSLVSQTVIATNKESTSTTLTTIYVVANGCTDETSALSRISLSRLASEHSFDWQVIEIEEAGKANAWNTFVHQILPESTSYAAMMDADVRLFENDMIEKCLHALNTDQELQVATPKLVKRFDSVNSSALNQLMVRAFSGTADSVEHTLAGAFYCGRADVFRKIVIPKHVVVEDGFVRAMVLTSGLTEQENLERIARQKAVSVTHIPYSTFSDIIRYQVRQAKGTAINLLIFTELDKLPSSFKVRMNEVRRRNSESPSWLSDLVAEAAACDRTLIPKGYTFRRVSMLKEKTGYARLKVVLLLPAIIFDIWIAALANRSLRADLVDSHWDRIRR